MNKIKSDTLAEILERIEDRLYSPEETAELLDQKIPTIRRRILERRIGYVKLGRNVRIPASEIKRLIVEGWREPVSK